MASSSIPENRTKITRRAILAGTPASAAVAVVGTSVSASTSIVGPDARLLAMAEEYRQLNAEADVLCDAGDGAGADTLTAMADDVLWLISETPAQTAADLVLKLQLAAEAFMMPDETVDHFADNGEVLARFLFPALGDTQRLASAGEG